jgi:disulfide oxidoreductase YuzD
VKDDPYFEMANKVDALLTNYLGADKFELKYIDISTPEVLDYIDDVNTIVENRLPLPYVAIGSKPVAWGLEEAEEIFDRIKEFLQKKQDG